MSELNIQYLAKGYKPRRKLKQEESEEQQIVVLHARAHWPEVAIVCATRGKNLSGRTKWSRIHQAKKIKREGYEKGTADMFFSAPRRKYHGLYIEMKKKGETKSSVTDEQRTFASKVIDQGYCWAACFGADHAIQVLDWYFANQQGIEKGK
jgi:hypothetical protein